jgi:hypothetical protein
MQRTRARTRAAAQAAPHSLTDLPLGLQLAVLALLPADARARCAAVSPAWRAAVADAALWTELDLTRAGGCTCASLNPATVLAALAPRLAHLRVLRVQTSCEEPEQRFSAEEALRALLRLARGGGAPRLRSLRLAGKLHLCYGDGEQTLLALAKTRQLALLEAEELDCGPPCAAAMLSAPSVRVRHVHWTCPRVSEFFGMRAMPDWLLSALAQHAALEAFTVNSSITPAELTRIVDIALTRRLTALKLSTHLPPGSVPQLARLLREGASLRRLTLEIAGIHLFNADNVAVFADALRANTTLQHLKLSCLGMWLFHNAGWSSALCAALEGHPSLESLVFYDMSAGHGVDAGAQSGFRALDASLAALLRANAPALTALGVRFNVGRGAPPLPLPLTFAALAHNTHLRELHAGDLDPDASFVRGALLPGVRACTSLRILQLGFKSDGGLCPDADRAVNEAFQAIAARETAGAAASTAL